MRFDRIDGAIGGVALLGILLSWLAVERIERRTMWSEGEVERARQGALAHLEALLDYLPFSEVVRAHNADPTDDPDGPGTAPGDRFVIEGLTPPQEGESHGTIEFFLDETTANGASLGEPAFTFTRHLGLPRDLDGDGDALDADVSDRYRILPIRVTVRWISPAGSRGFLLYGSRFGVDAAGSPELGNR